MKRWVSGSATMAAAAVLAGALAGAQADERLQPPTSDAVLMVGGNISRTTDGVAALFDLATLEALGMVAISVTPPGGGGPATFEGVPAKILLDFVGARGETVSVRTFDDCRVDLSLAELAHSGAILALKRDGDYLDARDLGPIVLVLGAGDALDGPCQSRLASVRVE